MPPTVWTVAVFPGLPGLQQEQFAPCDARFGSCRAFSFVAKAFLRPPSITARPGIRTKARRAAPSHAGQGQGASHSAIGRMTENTPQSPHS